MEADLPKLDDEHQKRPAEVMVLADELDGRSGGAGVRCSTVSDKLNHVNFVTLTPTLTPRTILERLP
jgi:hypothetical protein